MKIERDLLYKGANGKTSLYDMLLPDSWNNKVILFAHGYMGFKDWGAWDLVANYFVEHGFAFLKYNVSHNGCSTTDKLNFVDLESFKNNSYSKEVEDLEAMIELTNSLFKSSPEIHLIGHSRGGGIALLESNNNKITSISSWAGISTIETRFPIGDTLELWKATGTYYRKNGRTHQDMPHSYDQYLDYQKNKDRLDISYYVKKSKHPLFIIHGETDESVNIVEGEMLAKWSNTELFRIPDCGHTFGASHPYEKSVLPAHLAEACKATLAFIESVNSELQVKLSILSELVKLANSDKEFRDEEFQFLFVIADQLGVSKEQFRSVFDENIDFTPPTLETDRIIQFQRLVLMMNVDQHISEKELDYLRNAGLRMGLHPRATETVLNKMNDYENNVIPGDELIQIFRTFHN